MTLTQFIQHHRERGLSEELARKTYAQQKMVEEFGQPRSTYLTRQDDSEKLRDSELWFRREIIGEPSSYEDDNE